MRVRALGQLVWSGNRLITGRQAWPRVSHMTSDTLVMAQGSGLTSRWKQGRGCGPVCGVCTFVREPRFLGLSEPCAQPGLQHLGDITIQGHPWLQSKFRASLGYMTPVFKQIIKM